MRGIAGKDLMDCQNQVAIFHKPFSIVMPSDTENASVAHLQQVRTRKIKEKIHLLELQPQALFDFVEFYVW